MHEVISFHLFFPISSITFFHLSQWVSRPLNIRQVLTARNCVLEKLVNKFTVYRACYKFLKTKGYGVKTGPNTQHISVPVHN
jgi:hypothetical protein